MLKVINMKNLTDEREIEEYKEELYQQRLKEQDENDDFEWDGDEKELCSNCGTPINSHDQCPRCDY